MIVFILPAQHHAAQFHARVRQRMGFDVAQRVQIDEDRQIAVRRTSAGHDAKLPIAVGAQVPLALYRLDFTKLDIAIVCGHGSAEFPMTSRRSPDNRKTPSALWLATRTMS